MQSSFSRLSLETIVRILSFVDRKTLSSSCLLVNKQLSLASAKAIYKSIHIHITPKSSSVLLPFLTSLIYTFLLSRKNLATYQYHCFTETIEVSVNTPRAASIADESSLLRLITALISQCENLKYLVLPPPRLDFDSYIRDAVGLGAFQNLESFSFGKFVSDKTILELSSATPRMTSLTINHNKNLNDDILGKALSKWPNLTEFTVTNTHNVTVKTLYHLIDLTQCSTIRFQCCPLRQTSDEFDVMQYLVSSPNRRAKSKPTDKRQLKNLAVLLHHQHDGSGESMNDLAQFLEKVQVSSLEIGGFIQHYPLSAFQPTFKHFKFLTRLNLNYLSFSSPVPSTPSITLTSLLSRISNLTELCIQSITHFNDSHLQLPAIPSLSTLKLGFMSELSDNQIRLLTMAQSNLKNLVLFELPAITDLAVVSIAFSCPLLESIKVNFCQNVTGQICFIVLPQLRHLRHVELDQEKLGKEEKEKLNKQTPKFARTIRWIPKEKVKWSDS